jgi:hypothetical protein
MKVVNISDNIRISNKDKLNWNVEELKIEPDKYGAGPRKGENNPDAGKEKWICVGHYPGLKSAAKGALNRMNFTGPEECSVREMIDQIKNTERAVVLAVEQVNSADNNHPLAGRCATCEHWEGDRAEAFRMHEENSASMKLEDGWAQDGPCKKDYEFLDVIICGDAFVEREFAANFGCVYWKPHSGAK